jgi:UDP-glucose 4-epimerase
MRVAITGVGGVMGTGVAQILDRDPGIEMLGIDMDPPRRRLQNVDFHRVPPLEFAAMEHLIRDFDPEVIIHMGIYEPHARSNPQDAFRRTRASTRAVFLAALESPSLRHVVVRSGIEIYGRSRATPLRPDENTAVKPTTRFGKSLAEVEASAGAFAASCDVPVTVLRLAPVIGPYIPSPLGRYLRLPVVPFAAPIDGPIQLLHINDVHAAFVAAVRRRIGGVFNIVGHGAVTGSQAARMGGRAILPVWGPMWVLARAVTAALGSPLPEHSLEAMQRGQTADDTKARRILDFTPEHSTPECVADIYEWARIERIVPGEKDVA